MNAAEPDPTHLSAPHSAARKRDAAADGSSAGSHGQAEAYEARYRAGVASEVGVLDVVFRPNADRYPWQVYCTEERWVLVSRDLADHMLIGAAFGEEDREHRVSVETVPRELLDVVRRELYGARR